MYQQHPSYPSQGRHTPPNYHTRDQDHKIMSHSIHQSLYFESHRNNPQFKNDSNLWMTEQLRFKNSLRNYDEVVGQTLYDQICTNIENMIYSNSLTIQKLERNNEELRQHLENIKKIFSKIPIKRSHIINGIESMKEKGKKFTQEYEGKKVGQREFQQQNSEQNYKNDQQQKEFKIEVDQSRVKMQTHGLKKLYLPSKGPVKYTNKQYLKEQYFVQQFINRFLRDYIKVTPHEPLNIVAKNKILQLYLNWRTIEGLESELKQSRIQAIITNEIKVIFRCTCTLRDYVGMLLSPTRKLLQIEALKPKQADDIMIKEEANLQKKSPVLNAKQEMVEEQFSYGESQEELIVDNHHYQYS